jgi:hypothetical protein
MRIPFTSKNVKIKICRTVILRYVCENLPLTLKEEQRSRVNKNRLVKIIFGKICWKKFHKNELRNLYCPLNIIRTIKYKIVRWVRHKLRLPEMRNSYKILIGKT